jgi:hypothetical protein
MKRDAVAPAQRHRMLGGRVVRLVAGIVYFQCSAHGAPIDDLSSPAQETRDATAKILAGALKLSNEDFQRRVELISGDEARTGALFALVASENVRPH